MKALFENYYLCTSFRVFLIWFFSKYILKTMNYLFRRKQWHRRETQKHRDLDTIVLLKSHKSYFWVSNFCQPPCHQKHKMLDSNLQQHWDRPSNKFTINKNNNVSRIFSTESNNNKVLRNSFFEITWFFMRRLTNRTTNGWQSWCHLWKTGLIISMLLMKIGASEVLYMSLRQMVHAFL